MSSTPQVPAAELPFEILNQIFSGDAGCPTSSRDRNRDLKAWSLVCSQWRFAAQRELFAQITIKPQCPPPPNLYTAVVNNEPGAHVAAYIRHLILHNPARNPIVKTDCHFAGFLRHLAERGTIRTISLGNSPSQDFPARDDFSPENRVAFFKLLRSSNLSQLKIVHHYAPPLALITCCPNLVSLSCNFPRPTEECFNLGYDDDIREHRTEAPIKLQELQLRGTPNDILCATAFFADPRFNVSTEELKILQLKMSSIPKVEYFSIFRVCSSVEDLTVDYGTFSAYYCLGEAPGVKPSEAPRIYDVAFLRNLRRLTVTGQADDWESVMESPHDRNLLRATIEGWALEILRDLPHPELLESLSMRVPLREGDTPSVDLGPTDKTADLCWAALEGLLKNGQFTALRQVTLLLPGMKEEVVRYVGPGRRD